jgi:hypothetical protein
MEEKRKNKSKGGEMYREDRSCRNYKKKLKWKALEERN